MLAYFGHELTDIITYDGLGSQHSLMTSGTGVGDTGSDIKLKITMMQEQNKQLVDIPCPVCC